MPISMYRISVPVFARMLGNLAAILDKAAAHCEAEKIDPAALITFRLYPDMFAFGPFRFRLCWVTFARLTTVG